MMFNAHPTKMKRTEAEITPEEWIEIINQTHELVKSINPEVITNISLLPNVTEVKESGKIVWIWENWWSVQKDEKNRRNP